VSALGAFTLEPAAGPGSVRVALPGQVVALFAALAADSDSLNPLAVYATGPLAAVTAADSDPLDHLEAHLAAQRLAEVQAAERDEATAAAAALFTDGDALYVVIDAGTAALLLRWLNRMWITHRGAELAAAEQDTAVGAEQSGAGMLGLDDDSGSTPLGLPTLLLGAAVEELSTLLYDTSA
jgi:hypothetical protein